MKHHAAISILIGLAALAAAGCGGENGSYGLHLEAVVYKSPNVPAQQKCPQPLTTAQDDR